MPIRPILTDHDLARVLRRIDKLRGAADGTPQGAELDALVVLAEAYETKRWPLGESDPVEIIGFAMEQNGRTQADLAALLGSASRASEILRRRRPLTLTMIRRLAKDWGIPTGLLIGDYELAA